MKNNTTTKGLKDNKEELKNIRSVRQALQGKSYNFLYSFANLYFLYLLNTTCKDIQSENRSSSIRTPKRLLFKIKKRKDHDPNSNKIKTEGIKSTYDKKHRKKSRKIGNKKLHIGEEFNASDGGESPIFESFKKDFIKIKDEQAKSEGRRSYLFYRLTYNYFTN